MQSFIREGKALKYGAPSTEILNHLSSTDFWEAQVLGVSKGKMGKF